MILEQGGYYTKADFDQREVDMLAKIDGGRGLSTSDDGGIAMTYGNNVGGASVHYWADSYRTPPDRLQQWQDEFGLTGHDAATLLPHFESIERDLSVHPATDPYVNRMNQLLHELKQERGDEPAGDGPEPGGDDVQGSDAQGDDTQSSDAPRSDPDGDRAS